MKDKWFISDTHFFHANILKFTGKDGQRIRAPFQSIEEMHETMIAKWNSVVKDNDYVYHLGDVTFRYDGAFNHLMSRLKGEKRLIIGNHDKIWNPALKANFVKADIWKGFSAKQVGVKLGFTASHFPLPREGLRDGAFNLHGHTHQNGSPHPEYQQSVCVELTDWGPVHMDVVIENFKQKGG